MKASWIFQYNNKELVKTPVDKAMSLYENISTKVKYLYCSIIIYTYNK